MNRFLVILAFTLSQVTYSQRIGVQFLVVGQNNFVLLKKDVTPELKKAFRGKLKFKNDSAFCKPKKQFEFQVDSTIYNAIHIDSIAFKFVGDGFSRMHCEHDTNYFTRMKCFAWQDTIDAWRGRYPGYTLKSNFFVGIRSPRFASFTVIHKFYIKAFYKEEEFFSFQCTGNNLGRLFVDRCLKYDPNYVRIEISNIYMSISGQKANKFKYPGVFITDLKSKN
jgi:hypothetical protein